jgi:hypothetical protein
MAETSVGTKSFGALVAATAAATIPVGDAAAQTQPMPFSPTTTVTVEGGVSFSNYWATTFPGSPASLLPIVTDTADKTGFPPVFSDPLQSKHNLGGYGSFSIGRDIDPTLDWRFSVAFFDFGTTTSSANASQQFAVSGGSPFTNTASISEIDRFAFQTFDFDFGKRWTQQAIRFRAFAGLRGLHANENFGVATATEGTDKIGILGVATTDTGIFSNGTSGFTGLGPRIGFDFSTGSTFGFIGSASAAAIGGIRNSQFVRGTIVVVNGGPESTNFANLSSNSANWVGNLEGMLGVTWQFAPNGQLAVGYKVDEWYHIRDSFDFAGYGNKQNVLTQTPFLRVTLRY